MPNNLTIEERRSFSWKVILSVSLGVAILFLILFLVSNDPLIVGIFRLIAFIGFAAFVMSFLQMQSKIQKIKLELDEEHLKINYFSLSKKIR